METGPLLRTMLFAPGNHARRVEKALTLGADAVILDLEDAVATTEKAATRPLVAAARSAPRRCALYVRVNALHTDYCYEDLVAVVGPGLDGVVLPMVESAADLQTADWLLAQLERAAGLAPGTVDLLPIVETGKGVQNVAQIAAAGTRVRRLAFGAGDYTADMGMVWSADERELDHARQSILVASKAAGLDAPIDSAFARLDDGDGLARLARHVAAIGFGGKLCIHPSQVDILNDAFSPSPEEAAYARRVVDAFLAAETAGAAAIQVDGKFVDYPIYHRALKLVGRDEACRNAAAAAA